MKQYIALTFLALLFISGCSALKEQALSSAAKDWCMTIRGSQVIPVYPLTTDIRPGDVLLVQTSIEDQIAEYKQRGFLPINNLLTRLHNVNCCYDEFYTNSNCNDAGKETIPTDWNASALWEKAPAAVFPTYTVEYGMGFGGSVAFPVQGIPIGMGLLGSSKGTYTVGINDAYTYGLSDEIVAKAMYNWYVKDSKVRQLLADMVRQSNGKKLYLRVITRVFGTKNVNIQITADKKNKSGVDVAQTSPLAGINLTAENSVKNYTDNITALNKLISGKTDNTDTTQEVNTGNGLASARIQYFSNSTIGLENTFSTPVVIGYHAFDVQVLGGGILAPPLSTLDVLGNKVKNYYGPSATQRIIILSTLDKIMKSKNSPLFIKYILESNKLRNETLIKAAKEVVCRDDNSTLEKCKDFGSMPNASNATSLFYTTLSNDLVGLLESQRPNDSTHGKDVLSLISLWQLKDEITTNQAHTTTEVDCPCEKQKKNNHKK